MFPSDSLLNLTDVLNFSAESLQKIFLSKCSPQQSTQLRRGAASHLITLRGYCSDCTDQQRYWHTGSAEHTAGLQGRQDITGQIIHCSSTNNLIFLMPPYEQSASRPKQLAEQNFILYLNF